jgi:hypothetical protein
VKRSLRAEGPTRRSKPQPVGEVLEDIREDRPRGGKAARRLEQAEPPELSEPAQRLEPAEPGARATATGTVVRLCAALNRPTPPALPKPPAPGAAPGRKANRFNAVYTLEEIARSLETLAGRCEAKAQRLPARAGALLQMACLARISAWELRAERLPC